MTTEQAIALVQQRRTNAGLKLTWFIPAEDRTFTAYPKDEQSKVLWLEQAAARGWILV